MHHSSGWLVSFNSAKLFLPYFALTHTHCIFDALGKANTRTHCYGAASRPQHTHIHGTQSIHKHQLCIISSQLLAKNKTTNCFWQIYIYILLGCGPIASFARAHNPNTHNAANANSSYDWILKPRSLNIWCPVEIESKSMLMPLHTHKHTQPNGSNALAALIHADRQTDRHMYTHALTQRIHALAYYTWRYVQWMLIHICCCCSL